MYWLPVPVPAAALAAPPTPRPAQDILLKPICFSEPLQFPGRSTSAGASAGRPHLSRHSASTIHRAACGSDSVCTQWSRRRTRQSSAAVGEKRTLLSIGAKTDFLVICVHVYFHDCLRVSHGNKCSSLFLKASGLVLRRESCEVFVKKIVIFEKLAADYKTLELI